MIEITDVYFLSTDDPNFRPGIKQDTMLIDKKLILIFDSSESMFCTVTGEFDGVPAVDISICKYFRTLTKIDKNKVNWELMQMPFISAIKKLAK